MGRCARKTNIAQLSRAASITQRMPREQARFSLATWRNYEISASRRARVSEQSAQTCVEDRARNSLFLGGLRVEQTNQMSHIFPYIVRPFESDAFFSSSWFRDFCTLLPYQRSESTKFSYNIYYKILIVFLNFLSVEFILINIIRTMMTILIL